MKQVIRSVFNKLGIEIRLIKSVQAQLRDAFMEQQSLIGKNNAKVIFDVGAYDGGTAIKYHKYFPLATVYSFEPFAKSFIKLDETASKNSFIIPINAAASDKVDIANLYVNNMDATNSLLPSAITNSYLDGLTKLDHIESVITTTIDQICIERNIDFIDILKIDVQGGGLEVLRGSSNALKSKKIKLIYIEIEFIEIYKDQPLMFKLTEFLSSHNYKLFGLYNLVHQKCGQLAWGDAIYYSEDMEPTIQSMNA